MMKITMECVRLDDRFTVFRDSIDVKEENGVDKFNAIVDKSSRESTYIKQTLMNNKYHKLVISLFNSDNKLEDEVTIYCKAHIHSTMKNTPNNNILVPLANLPLVACLNGLVDYANNHFKGNGYGEILKQICDVGARLKGE